MTHYLMVTHGSDGDVLPFVRIGAALATRGHRVALLTHAPYAPAAARAGLDFAPIDDEAAFEATLAATAQLLGTGPARIGWAEFYRRTGQFGQIAAECRELLRRHEPGRTVYVGRHTSGVSVRFAAELTGAPSAWIALSPTQVMAAPVAAHTYATELYQGFDAIRADLGRPPIRDWAAWFAGADAEIGLWPEWFDRAGPRAPGRVATVGFPLADAEPAGAAETADIHLAPGTVIATGGTGRMLDAAYYRTLVDAAAAGGWPTVLVVRHRDLLPAQLPSTVDWRPRLPYAKVLPQAAAIVHHGGIGTAVRALAAGTPQVLLADGIDRPDNAARLARCGLARAVYRLDPAAVVAEVDAALRDEGYPARAAEVRDSLDTGVPTCVSQLEALAGAGIAKARTGLAERIGALSPRDRARLHARLDATRAPTGGR